MFFNLLNKINVKADTTKLNECPICMESYSSIAKSSEKMVTALDNNKVQVLSNNCSHSICLQCYRKLAAARDVSSCPLCRSDGAFTSIMVPAPASIVDPFGLVQNDIDEQSESLLSSLEDLFSR